MKAEDPRHIARRHLVEALYAGTYTGTKLPSVSPREKKELQHILAVTTELNEHIDRYAQTFDHSKMAKIDYAILQLGVYELFFSSNKPPFRVVINEAIELAKEYGSEGSPKLINGILGKAAEEKHGKN